MPSADVELPQGALMMMILKTLSWGPMHGYAIARWLQDVTDDALCVGEGSLYPALHRLREKRWVTSAWGTSDSNRRAKFYQLTPLGRAQLKHQLSGWERLADMIGKVLAADVRPASGGTL
jgi:transcriptional regulator